MQIHIIGIYPVSAPEPCYLVELHISDLDQKLDMCEFTQIVVGSPRSNWQVPYDEVYLNTDGVAPFDETNQFAQPGTPELRVAFFFHCLDASKPFETPVGPVQISERLPLPDRLSFIKYEAP